MSKYPTELNIRKGIMSHLKEHLPDLAKRARQRRDERATITNVADNRGEAACCRGQRSVLLAIESVTVQLERLREGKTDERFTDFEQLLVDMFCIGADGCKRITGESLTGEPSPTNLLSGCRTEG